MIYTVGDLSIHLSKVEFVRLKKYSEVENYPKVSTVHEDCGENDYSVTWTITTGSGSIIVLCTGARTFENFKNLWIKANGGESSTASQGSALRTDFTEILNVQDSNSANHQQLNEQNYYPNIGSFTRFEEEQRDAQKIANQGFSKPTTFTPSSKLLNAHTTHSNDPARSFHTPNTSVHDTSSWTHTTTARKHLPEPKNAVKPLFSADAHLRLNAAPGTVIQMGETPEMSAEDLKAFSKTQRKKRP